MKRADEDLSPEDLVAYAASGGEFADPVEPDEAELAELAEEADAVMGAEPGTMFNVMRGMLGALNAKRIRSPGRAAAGTGLAMTAFSPTMYGGVTEAQRAAADRRHAKNRVARRSRRTTRRRNKR